MNARRILRLAAELTADEAHRLAGACGWPRPSVLQRGGSIREIRVTPYRRHYCTHRPADATEWARVYAEGLVAPEDAGAARVTWEVTDLGVEVLRARLLAEWSAWRAGGAG